MSIHQTYRPSLLWFASLLLLVSTSARADFTTESAEKEKNLIAVLRSDAAPAEKALACKNLAIHGSDASVDELAKLLPDPQLSSWARIALEAIPGEKASEALRMAANSLEGRLLVGMINSLGVRRDAEATEALSLRLDDKDAEVASAAAVALGRIGSDEATNALRQALVTAPEKVRSAVAEGCVLCAERMHLAGKSSSAAELYDQVRAADVPTQRVIEATRGAILARGDEGIPLLMETFRSPNKKHFQLALATAREFPGGKVDRALAEELARATPDRAALMIQAMADRPDTVVLAAIAKAATEGDRTVRMSAIDALGRVGNDSSLTALLEIATDEDAGLADAAKLTLSSLRGESVDSRIVTLLSEAQGKNYPLLLGLIGQRRIDAVDAVVPALDHSDAAVRAAALVALGETVSLDRLPLLVTQAIRPKHSADQAVAVKALKTASVRMPDREACAEELSDALDRAPSAAKSTLLEILSDVGGTKALNTLAAAAKSSDPELQDTGSRLLGKWNGVDAAPVLMDLAKSAPSEKYRVRALRGYIGLARKFAMPEPKRAEMCRQAWEAAHRTAERQLVLDVLKLHPSTDGLKLAIDAKRNPELKNEATAATLSIAQKIGGSGVDVSALVAAAGLDPVKLEIIKAQYGAGAKQKDVTAVVRRQAANSPFIALKSASYNTSFGGDPVPGQVKQLTIQYRMDGKSGEATFKENDAIVLPMPK